MNRFLKRFHDAENGAVTVDWVVLTAGLLIFGILVVSTISQGATSTAGGMGAKLSAAQVPDVSF